jgi:hypothetical protein
MAMSPIKGVWKNPTKSRCDVKAAYPSMAIAEAKASSASSRAGHLIIAYKCFDCGAFHIGHPDLSQRLAHPKKVKIKTPPVCVLCGIPIQKRLGRFIKHPQGYACGTKKCRWRCNVIRRERQRELMG